MPNDDPATTLSETTPRAEGAPTLATKATSRKSRALARTPRRPEENLADVAFWPVLAIAPTTVGLVVEAVAGKRARNAGVLAALGTTVGLGLFRWQLARLFAEEPAYVVERRIGRFEIRAYPATVRAETKVSGLAWRAALDEGFQRLFGYISKGNEADERIRMTAPVTTFRDHDAAAAIQTTGTSDDVIVAFMMPARRARASLPAPRDARVQLVEGASRRVAVLRYQGSFDADVTRAKQRELYAAMQRVGLKAVGNPAFAGYDPPTTLPFLRRNEVWIEVEAAAS
jgi:hypothetical protein